MFIHNIYKRKTSKIYLSFPKYMTSTIIFLKIIYWAKEFVVFSVETELS